MKKTISLLMVAALLLTLTTGCRKNKVAPTEATTVPTTEATAAPTQEMEQETTAPTVDVLKEAPSAFEDKPEETTKPVETTPPATKPASTTPPATEIPAPPPEDNSDNDLGWG